MHELSIAMALVEDVERALFRNAAERAPGDPGTAAPHTFVSGSVSTVRVRIGALAGVDPDALRQAFPVAAENTCCDQAALDISAVRTQAVCLACHTTFEPEFPFCVCTGCGSTDVEITGGRELLLESIELNETDHGKD